MSCARERSWVGHLPAHARVTPTEPSAARVGRGVSSVCAVSSVTSTAVDAVVALSVLALGAAGGGGGRRAVVVVMASCWSLMLEFVSLQLGNSE